MDPSTSGQPSLHSTCTRPLRHLIESLCVSLFKGARAHTHTSTWGGGKSTQLMGPCASGWVSLESEVIPSLSSVSRDDHTCVGL